MTERRKGGGEEGRGETKGEAGDSVRKEKGKKFPWQADEQVDEGRSGGDTNEEGEGGKKTRARGSELAYYVKRTQLFSLACVPPRSFILYSKAL